MASMSATFPSLNEVDALRLCHVLRGGFDFMIPTSSGPTAEVTVGGIGPKRSVSGEGLAIPGVSFLVAMGSWALDTWTHLDLLFTPGRVDMWIDGDLVASSVVFPEKLEGSLIQFSGCEAESLWVVGGDLT